jgi:TRAP-type C4-dicarboxylate transport system substrate-binding protein
MAKGEENTDAEIESLMLRDVQSSLIKTRCTEPVGLYVMNKAQYDALTDGQKEWLVKLIKQAEQEEIAAVALDEKELETKFAQKKMAISEPSPELLAALKNAVQPVVDLVKTAVDPALADAYIAACRNADPGSVPAQSPGASAPSSPAVSPRRRRAPWRARRTA